jgi:hypothetical protein
VLLLPSVFHEVDDFQELLLPLTLAYLLSTHLPFRFPMSAVAVTKIERLFDGILNGLPKESKGILYLTEPSQADIVHLLQGASLVLTDEAGIEQIPGISELPHAVVCRSGDQMRSLKLRRAEKLQDEGLKAKLMGCAQLINVQTAGFITEGHFSLSW